jgi:hypothetical protein
MANNGTLLSIVQNACGELGLSVPSSVAGNEDPNISQMMYLVNSVGQELAGSYNWQSLISSHRFNTEYVTTTGDTTEGSNIITNIPSLSGSGVAADQYMVSGDGIASDCWVTEVLSVTSVEMDQDATSTQVGATIYLTKQKYELPDDFEKQINKTHYDKSKRWEMLGPETPQEWEFLHSSYISTGPRIRYRIAGGFFEIWPIITTTEYLGFDYISSGWVESGVSVAPPRNYVLLDTDIIKFDSRLMVIGLKRRFFEIKDFDTSVMERDFERYLAICKSKDAGAKTLSMSPMVPSVLIGYDNIPDGSIYGQQT